MTNSLLRTADRIIEYSFYLLFFITPLILTPFNYELFEYNKMMATYALTVVITGAWITKMVIQKEIRLARTPLDIPLVLFLVSQIAATLISVDRHLSIFGYYSRFNGGLLSVVSYFLLYYAFVTNFPKEKIRKLLFIVLSSGFIVSIYGILEHFGIDRDLWVQDVQNRVFSTLGQPNWLAAYLAILIPIALIRSVNIKPVNAKHILDSYWSFYLKSISKNAVRVAGTYGFLSHLLILGIKNVFYVVISIIFYITLLFTKSRSGFMGFWISLIIFCLLYLLSTYLLKKQSSKTPQIHAIAQIYGVNTKLIWVWIFCFVLITFFLGTPFAQINRFTYSELFKRNQQLTTENLQPDKPIGSSIIDVGVTESGTIRRIVWQGAIDIFKHYPVFGTGVETFALAYYKFRPVEHNMTSEWDFLYNKAHNEYLNYAATTGGFGLGSYLLIIITFILWFTKRNSNIEYRNSKQYQNKNDKKTKHFESLNFEDLNLFGASNFEFRILIIALFSAWLSILITNFFGFSVVVIQLFFFLIPAISYVLFSFQPKPVNRSNETINTYQKFLIISLLFIICYMLYILARLWYADTIFARGYHLAHGSEPDYLASYKALKQAIKLNRYEPFYFDELAIPASMLSVALNEEKLASASSQLRDEAITASDIAIAISPSNVNFWKNRTRVFYTLTVLEEKYFWQAKEALLKAADLAPTDPKIRYNLALIYDRLEERQTAIDLLQQTITLKKNYKEAYLALGLLYEQEKETAKAIDTFNFVLTKLDPNDEIAKTKMEELKRLISN